MAMSMPMPMTPDSMQNNSMDMKDMAMHMSFFWGKDATVLFKGWPGDSIGMYILALIFVFFLGFSVEITSMLPVKTRSSVVGGLASASVHAVRMALAYLVMLSVMSFNIAIFILAVAGHALGYFLVKYRSLAVASRSEMEPNTTNHYPKV